MEKQPAKFVSDRLENIIRIVYVVLEPVASELADLNIFDDVMVQERQKKTKLPNRYMYTMFPVAPNCDRKFCLVSAVCNLL